MKTSLSDKKSNVLCISIPCGCSLWKLWVSFQHWWSELLWYCAFLGGWMWMSHSVISFNLMPFDLQLCIMFLYYSFDGSSCRSHFLLPTFLEPLLVKGLRDFVFLSLFHLLVIFFYFLRNVSSFIFYLPFKILVSLSVSCFLIILSWHHDQWKQ